MKALLINPLERAIEVIDLAGRDDISRLVGFDTVTSDEIGPDGDRLFFDEECFLRGTQGRFQIDSVVPVSGKAVIVGSADDGETLCDVVSSVAAVGARLKYL